VLAIAPLGATHMAWAAPADTPGAVSVEVLAIASNDAVDEAAALTDAFKHALIEAAGMVDNGKSHALEAVALTVGCDDAMANACAPKIAAEIKQNRFVYGTLKKAPGNKLTTTLHYYDNGQIKTVAKTYDGGPVAKDGTSPELKKIALEVLYQLVGGPPKGAVTVTVSGPAGNDDGDLYEGGTKVGHVTNGKASIELPSGSHTIELRVNGYASTTGTVEVTPAGTTLQLAPVKLAPSKPLDWQLYGGIAAMAAGAVFIGLGVSASLATRDAQDDPTFTQYRKRFPSSVSDTCAEAKKNSAGSPPANAAEIASVNDTCDRASSKQKQQIIFYALGGVLLGGGAILVLTDKKSEEAKPEEKEKAAKAKLQVQVQPSFGIGFGSLSLVGRF